MASKINGISMENESDGFKNQWKIEAIALKIKRKSIENKNNGFKNQRKIDGK